MQVIACIKQVPDTTQVKIDPVTNTLVREGIPFIVNPYDTHALEAALDLKDKYGVSVTVVTMGPPNSANALKKALAMGADRAILLSDRAFGGADTLATSKVITAALAKLQGEEEIGLIFCGKQTIDGDTAQVGPGIASRMKIPQLTLVDNVEEFTPASKKIRVRRKLEGRYERVESKMPALVTVVREINSPRYPTVPTRLKSFNAPIETWDNSDLKIDPETIGLKGSATWVSKIFSPEREKGEIVGDGINAPQEAAAQLIDKLLSKDVLSF
ncbi:electron transfer flavoprotein subunit beta/FixA family protein [Desulfotalea psychrophila]|uniref:Probable electron transfer flavoprotein, beta subunit n=1 Tax=Desulfotalea psychrophila (strain LSv54 / DSM 12343) TaxID=177439 RepID=Q6AIQ1_DESPS|nr:electron transfer flavoprotein subunit beta/FixA family protein [Desulfotalea psychrophila]CAG37779.1 probable electron transfer flavoprotein, beta subunit [Desulfotalea psychrophila LSv54]